MKSIFSSTEQQELKSRIQQLSPDAQKQWGKMDVAQMCSHCSTVLDVNAGRQEEAKPGLMVKLLKPMIRKVVFGEKPYKKNQPTSPQFLIKDSKNFEVEKQKLEDCFDYYTDAANMDTIVAHPSKVFGQVSKDEKGWAMYKHLNHHLEQFGV